MKRPSEPPDALAPTLSLSPMAAPRASTLQGGVQAPLSRPPSLPPGEQVAGDEEEQDGSLPIGEVVGERYRLVRLVGRGGQGDVYRADDLAVEGHVVALKLMHQPALTDEERAFAVRELRMLAAVSHPAIVQFKDTGWYGARPWFVMPWLRGKTLEDAGAMSRAEARRVFENVAAGVAALHAKGIRHQDIKPANIFLAEIDGFEATMPMLLDLGVAAHGDDALVAGSPDYFAPEVAGAWPVGEPDIGPEADMFALALALRQTLDPSAKVELDPYSREALKKRASEPLAPPQAPEFRYLRSSFRRWLAIDPAERPTAEEFLNELEILTAPEDRARERNRILRRIAPYAAILAVVLALVGYQVKQELDYRAKLAAKAELESAASSRLAETAQASADEARAEAEAASQRAAEAAENATEQQRAAEEAADRVDRARRALNAARGDRSRLESAMSELQQALDQAEAARTAESRALARERAELARAESALADLEERLQAEQRQAGTLQRGLTDSQTQLQAALSRSRELESSLALAEQRFAQTQVRLDATEAALRTAQASASDAQQALQAAQNRIVQLEARVRQLQSAATNQPTQRLPSTETSDDPQAPVVVLPPTSPGGGGSTATESTSLPVPEDPPRLMPGPPPSEVP